MSRDKIAVIIPCYNEALTIGKVIDDFRRELPEASVYVYDNRESPRLPFAVDIPANRRRCETCCLRQLLLAHAPLLEQAAKFISSQCCHSVPFLGCMWQKNYRISVIIDNALGRVRGVTPLFLSKPS